MKRLISCDWGTTSLRIGVVDLSNKSVLIETSGDQGILKTFELWKGSGKAEAERILFYQTVIAEQIRLIEIKLNLSLQGEPIVISGMASSNIGMVELPYKQMPFALDGNDLEIKLIRSEGNFKHEIILISGARTSDDVMRGEESQLIGCIQGDEKGERLFIFPGTHSKHVLIRDNQVIDVTTYMTGEFFELLGKKSILANDIGQGGGDVANNHREIFKKAVRDALHANILHNSFLIRVNSILGKSSREENYYYLSGLLIGTELKGLAGYGNMLSIVGNKGQEELYWIALHELGINTIRSYNAAMAAIHGHCRIYDLYKSELKMASGLTT